MKDIELQRKGLPKPQKLRKLTPTGLRLFFLSEKLTLLTWIDES
jgi:hypothetical protein